MSEITYIPFIFPGIPNVKCAFQTRVGGSSFGPYANGNICFSNGDNKDNVEANRKSLHSVLGLNSIAFAKQMHGKNIIFDPDPENRQEGDGLATNKKNLGIAVMTADCQPLMITDNTGQYICAMHVGWQGNKIKFPNIAIAEFCRHYHLIPSQLCVVRGPSIGYSKFPNFNESLGRPFARFYNPETQTVDLWSLTKSQLIISGVLSKNIYSIDLCTYSLPDMFFSYSRDKVSGLHANVIWISK